MIILLLKFYQYIKMSMFAIIFAAISIGHSQHFMPGIFNSFKNYNY